MKSYFIANIYFEARNEASYRDYIQEVKPIVEQFGGRYLVRTERITHLSEDWKPDRVIVIEFPSQERLEACFSSEQYRNIKSKRENSVRSMAIIVNGVMEHETLRQDPSDQN